MPGADLHLHSTASDGADPPALVCRRASDAGLDTLALTDHDSLAGIPEAIGEAARLGVEVIPGCELTAYMRSEEVHVLGYGVGLDDPELASHLEQFRSARRRRLDEMVGRLREAGAEISLDRVLELAGGEGAVGRVHVARALLEAGHVHTFQEAFARFLVKGRPGHVPKMAISPHRAIDLIHRAGGVAVLAHPAVNNLQAAIPALVRHGLDGLEVWHSLHRPDQSDSLFNLAMRFGLLKTGGSDCHGALPGREPILGGIRVDRPHVEALRRAIQRRHDSRPR